MRNAPRNLCDNQDTISFSAEIFFSFYMCPVWGRQLFSPKYSFSNFTKIHLIADFAFIYFHQNSVSWVWKLMYLLNQLCQVLYFHIFPLLILCFLLLYCLLRSPNFAFSLMCLVFHIFFIFSSLNFGVISFLPLRSFSSLQFCPICSLAYPLRFSFLSLFPDF